MSLCQLNLGHVVLNTFSCCLNDSAIKGLEETQAMFFCDLPGNGLTTSVLRW